MIIAKEILDEINKKKKEVEEEIYISYLPTLLNSIKSNGFEWEEVVENEYRIEIDQDVYIQEIFVIYGKWLKGDEEHYTLYHTILEVDRNRCKSFLLHKDIRVKPLFDAIKETL